MMGERKRNWLQKGQISLQELFYYLFFGILLFAKGIGLYDGQESFKLLLVLAVLCWIVKMGLTKMSIKEAIVIFLLVATGFISYRASGEKAALVSVLAVTGMKDISVKRVFRVGLIIWTVCFFGTVMLSLTGVIEPLMLVHDKAGLGYVIRNSLGYTHPNVLHISYVVLIAFWFYTFGWRGKKALAAVTLAFLGNLYIFIYSLSYTGFALTMAYLVLVLYFTFRTGQTKAERIVIQCLMPVCVLTSLFAPLLLQGRAFEIADKIVNTRFRLSKHYLTTEKLTLFGAPIQMGGGWSIDCSYVYCLLFYGVILFSLFMLGYFFLIRHLLRKERGKELALVLGLLAAGFTEPFLFNFSFKNLTLPFLGEYLFLLLCTEGRKNGLMARQFRILQFDKTVPFIRMDVKMRVSGFLAPVWKRAKLWIPAVCFAGMCASMCVGAFCVQIPSYVIVNKGYSDRVGGRDDYEIFGELPDEIVKNSLQIQCEGPDTKVYVFSGNTIKMEWLRMIVTLGLTGAVAAGMLCFVVFYLIQKRWEAGQKNKGG